MVSLPCSVMLPDTFNWKFAGFKQHTNHWLIGLVDADKLMTNQLRKVGVNTDIPSASFV